jgi:hypothetical protein
VELEIKCNNLTAENKRIITSKTINASNNPSNNSMSSNGSSGDGSVELAEAKKKS